MPKKNPVITVLKKARKLIAKGWFQGEFEGRKNRTKCYCAWGAIKRVTGGGGALGVLEYEAEAKNALEEDRYVVRCHSGVKYNDSIVDYNDKKGRTQQQVLNLFDRTIARLEKKAA